MITRDAHMFADALNEVLSRTTGYRYAVFPKELMLAATTIPLEPDAYIADEPGIIKIREYLGEGYRWIRTDGDSAILEKVIKR